MRTDIPTQRLSASLLPPEVEPVERDHMRLLEKALSPSYTLVKRLGAGGMGAVYLARDPVLKRLVAVKVMAPALAADAEARARFEREAQAVASISHPNVVAVHSVGELENGVPYFVMQYIEGRTMAERLAQDGPLDARTAKRVLGEVASALAAAHRKGVIHRDIKPSNILWDDDTGRAMVSDFGIAAVLEREDEREPVKITHTGMAIGTPAYMSPEQLLAEQVTEKSDIYSLGLLGYELFIADGPYAISSPRELMAAHLRDTPRKLSTMRADIDPEVERLLEQCLAKDPSRRPSAADVERRLAHGASILLEWPPPGLEHLNARLRDALQVLNLGAFGAGIPLVGLSLFDRESFVRQTLPPTLVLIAITFVGLLTFLAGLEGLRRFLRDARKAVGLGYGWFTILEATADDRRDTGALIAGGREYAELTPEARNTLRRNRVLAMGLRVIAGLTPVLGYVAGVLLFARAKNGPTYVLWASLLLSLILFGVARLITWTEARMLAPVRRRVRTVATLSEGLRAIAQAWTATFEQVRHGQRYGPGPTSYSRGASIATGVVLSIALLSCLGIFLVQSLTGAIAAASSVAIPRYSNIRLKVLRVDRLRAYRVPADTTITPLRAGQALYAILRNGPGGESRAFEKQPVIVIPPQPVWPTQSDPFPAGEGNWAVGAFKQARRGYTVAQRDFLRATADNAALEEFRILARAPSVDLVDAYWALDAGPRWIDLPIPRFVHARNAANANVAQAALDFSAGRTQEAERRLRETISAGFLMINEGRLLIENLVGANIVHSARQSLAAFYEVTGKAADARFVSTESDPDVTIIDPMPARIGVDEVNQAVSRSILDETLPLGLRWELVLSTIKWMPCADMHQVLFGPDASYRRLVDSARASLVRRQSDSLLFSVAARVDPPPGVKARFSVWTAHRPVARIVSTLTGKRQLEDCVSLLSMIA